MGIDFNVEYRVSNGNLHVTPRGALDGSSAWELINLLHEKYSGQGRVFIETEHLREICPFGSSAFQRGLNPGRLPPDRMVFKGENGFKIAPAGSRVIVVPRKRKHPCTGKCGNCTCRRNGKYRNGS